MPRVPLLFALLALLPSTGAAEAAPLEGRWCLTGVATTDGSRSRPIAREWVFARGGVLRVQSEASADVRMSVGYRREGSRLLVPELDLRLDIERNDGSEMTALGREGKLRYRFRRGRCRDSDREAVREARDGGEREAGGDRGDGDGGDRRRSLP